MKAKAQNTKVSNVETLNISKSDLPKLFMTTLPTLKQAEKSLVAALRTGKLSYFFTEVSKAYIKAVNARILAVNAKTEKQIADANEAYNRLNDLDRSILEILQLGGGIYDIEKLHDIFVVNRSFKLLILESDRIEKERREKAEKKGKEYLPFNPNSWTEQRFLRCLKNAVDKRPKK